MRIGIDIDGVLTDIEQWQLDYGSKYYYEKANKKIKNFEEYETADIFESTTDEDNLFWNEYFEFYSKNVKARELASEVIKRLKDENNEIFIITARGNFLSHSGNVMGYEKNKLIVIKWLKENNIIYDNIIFTPEDKLDICIKNNIELMIEDKPENIMNISTKIPIICFHANYNKNCSGEKIYRCYSWYDIYSTIKEELL